MLDKSLVLVDVETTGGSQYLNRIIEVGLVRIENGKLVDTYSTLINPYSEVPSFITELTGITNEAVLDAPGFEDVALEIQDFLSGATFIAHNVMFDYAFLKNEFMRIGINLDADKLCTVKLSRLLYPDEKRHNLSSLIERHSIPCKNRHRALDDALVLWDFIEILKKSFSKNELDEAINKVMSLRSVPNEKAGLELVYEYE